MKTKPSKLQKLLAVSIAAMALLVVVVVFVTPVAVRHVAQNWLREQGVDNAAITDVNINLFTGVVEIDTVNIAGGDARTGALDVLLFDIDMLALFSKRFEVAGVTIQGGEFDIHSIADGGFHIGALQFPLRGGSPDEGAGPTDWHFAVRDVDVDDVVIRVLDQRHEASIDIRDLSIDQIATLTPEQRTTLSADVEVDGARVRLGGYSQPLAERPMAEFQLRIDDFDVSTYASLIPAVDAPQGMLSVDVQLFLSTLADLETTLELRIAGGAAGSGIAATLGAEQASVGQLSVEGDASIRWSASREPVLSATTDSVLEDIRFGRSETSLLELQRLGVESLEIDDGKLAVAAITASGIRSLVASDTDTKEPLIVASGVRVVDIGAAAEEGVSVGRIDISDTSVSLQRDADGQLRGLSGLAGNSDGDAGEPVGDESTLPVSVGVIEFSGDSRLRFEDAAVDPAFTLDASLPTLTVNALSTDAGAAPATFELQLEEGETTRLAASGSLHLATGDEPVTVNASLSGFELPRVSSYLPGYDIERGRLAVESQATLAGGELDVDNTVTLDRLKLSAQSEDAPDLLGDAMDMPLDLALDLLRDGDDRIKLDIPVSGRLDDLEFGTGDVFRLATQRALQRAAVNYVTKSLQPLGTILFVSKVAGKASRPRFEPIVFEAGGSELAGDGAAYAERIAEILSKRPRLSITFCGVAAPADRLALQAQAAMMPEAGEAEAPAAELDDEAALAALAEARTASLRSYLVDVQGIDAERLYRCREVTETDDDSVPRIEVTL